MRKKKVNGGRPLRKFTQKKIKQIADCALHGCYTRTIATLTGIPESTLRDRFRALMHKKRAERKLNLRKAQDEQVEEGNTAILIFLGKNELDQTDKQEHRLGLSDELSDLLGLIDGSSKGKLPDSQESENSG